MKLQDLVKPLEEMTDEELFEHLRKIRHNRERERPVAKAKAAKAAKKESAGKQSKLGKLIAGLSPREQAEILKQLGGETSNGTFSK